jgi:outer membrane protein
MKKASSILKSSLIGLVLTSFAMSGCTGSPGGTTGNSTTSVSEAAKVVGSLEQEAVFQLPEFKKAKEDIDKKVKTRMEALEKEIPKGKPPTPEQQRKIRDVQLDLQKESGKILNPLKNRAEAAIRVVAAEKNMLVVLDKRIVVFGVTDITDDVKKLFQSETKEIKLPPEADVTKAPIGYFDQEVVRSLKIFQEAEMSIYKKRSELLAQFEAKVKTMSPSERELLERELRLKMETYQETIMQPLMQEVTDSVKDVAQAQGLSLVLDKQHVMQGGRNMTNEVVEAFLKRAGGKSSPKAASTPGAKPSASPEVK